MNREDALKISDDAIEQLTSALEQGHSEKLTAYIRTLSRFHRYSFGNVMLITFQRPNATHVAGYATWKKLGRHVKKGEHGLAILAPIVCRPKLDENSLHPTASDEEQRPTPLRGFKVVSVFDVSQTDGKPLPQFARVQGSPGEYLDRLSAIVQSHGIKIEHAEISSGAQGLSLGGTITIRPDLEPADEFSVLVHEFAHELLHKGERRMKTTKLVRETEAEAVAFVVSHAIGLESSSHSSDYIQLYQGDKDTLAESLDYIQRTATKIIRSLNPTA